MTLSPGTYRLFTDGNEGMPSGGPVPGTDFVITSAGTSFVSLPRTLTPGTYRLFTDGNADMPWGGAVPGTDFVIAADSSGGTGGTGLPRPATQAELQALINAAVAARTALVIDPTTPPLTINSTVTIPLTDAGDNGWFFDFGRVPMQSAIVDGVMPLFKLSGAAKHLVFKNLVIYGGNNSWGANNIAGCGDGLQIISSGGPILLSQFQDISVSWCNGNGVSIQGDVYESSFYGLDCKNNILDGLRISTPNGGVISNLRIISPDLSSNNGYGCRVLNYAQSIDLPAGGSFICNGLGGWSGPLRLAMGVNGENTGPYMFDFSGGLPYPATILACNLTSDNATFLQNTSGSGPSTTLIKYATPTDGKLQQMLNYCTPEGSSNGSMLKVVG
jgi:hypothetical protein